MNKKKIGIGVMAIVCVAVVVFIVVLLTKTANMDMEQNSNLQFKGTWKIATYESSIIENEYFVFSDTDVKYYKDGNSEPVLTSTYEYTKKGKLSLKETDMVFSVDAITNNVVGIKDDADGSVRVICRWSGDGYTSVSEEKVNIDGNWDVIIHGGSLAGEETISFGEDICTVMKSGELYFEGTYSWTEDGEISIEGAGLLCDVCAISDETIIMIDKNAGYAWELQRIAE